VEVGGVPLAERAVRTLSTVADPVVLVTDDELVARTLGRPRIPDLRNGAGPLAGVETALSAAEEEGRPGALILACDMPLVPSALLKLLLEQAPGREVVLPESPGPLGVEPLCGYYSVQARRAVEEALEAGRRSMHAFLARLSPDQLTGVRVAGIGPPERVFLNVNTPGDRERAEALLSSGGNGSGEAGISRRP